MSTSSEAQESGKQKDCYIQARFSKTFDKGKLHRWCREGKYFEIIDLISEGLNLQSYLKYGTGVFGYTPLHESCVGGHYDITKLLLKEGADPDVRCSNKYTPLHLATVQRHYACVKILIKNGAKIDVKDNYNRTPLDLAVERKSTKIINLLMGEQLKRACKGKDTEEINNVLINASRYKPNPILPEDYNQCLLDCVDSSKIRHMRKILLFSIDHSYSELIERADMRGNMEIVAYLFLCLAASENKIQVIRCILNSDMNKIEFSCRSLTSSLGSSISVKEEMLLQKCLPHITSDIDRIIPMMLARKKRNSAAVLELLLNIDCNSKTKKICWEGLKIEELEVNVLQKVAWVEELHLGTNQLKKLNENICTCQNLVKLILNRNKIDYINPLILSSLASLEELDLSENSLTTLRPAIATNALRKLNLSGNKIFILPDGLILPNVQTLNLSYNKLNRLPDCVTNMTTLYFLDISYNMGIFTLPLSLGKLEKLIILGLDGLPELNRADFPKNAYDPLNKKIVSSVLIQHYKHKYQNSQEFNKLKIYVVGKQNRGKSTLVRRLKDNKDDINISTVGIEMSEWSYPSRLLTKKSINYIMWDFGGQEEYYAAHQCFLSQGSLYLLVWNLTHGEDGIKELLPWLDNIKARTPRTTLIIVATHLDMLSDREEAGKLLELLAENVHKYRTLNIEKIMCVSCLPSKMEFIFELKEVIHQTALKIKSQSSSKCDDNIFGIKVPQYYITLDKKITALNKDLRKQKKSPILTLKDFQKTIETWSISDLVGKGETMKAINFLHKAGKLLYYDDPNSGLNELVFVNPQWLCNMMANIITIKTKNPFVSNGLMEVRHFYNLFKGQSTEFPSEYFDCYLHLLEKFEVGLNIGKSVLLIPSLLPTERPSTEIFSNLISNPFYARVVLGVDLVPYGFWSRFLSRLLHNIQELQQHIHYIKRGVADMIERDGWCNIEIIAPTCSIQNSLKSPITTILTQTRNLYSNSNPIVLKVWRQGLFYDDKELTFLVESLKSSNLVSCQKQGVLIMCSKEGEGCSKFGLICDTLLDLCNSWYPGVQLETFLLSEEVVHTRMDLNKINLTLPSIYSWFENPNTPINVLGKEYGIEELAPDLLLLDLPKKFVLNAEHFEFDFEKTLGKGGYGSVFVGKYKGKSVAIKTYHQTRNSPESKNEALCELRRESMVLKNLYHPCLIGFVGILIKPQMSLVLEIAPMGSLCDLLKKSGDEGRAPFARQLYYLIAIQVALGLDFLHTRPHPIIFRDLKPSNVLVVSIDPLEQVQVKLTDFGIAAYLQPSGYVGLEGTKGFQAPEILKYGGKVYYDHRVDIFSYGMLMYNIVSGSLPYNNVDSIYIDSLVIDNVRPSLSIELLNFGLCFLENIIRLSWDEDPKVRPNARSIVELISQPTFQSIMCVERIIKGQDIPFISYSENSICYVLKDENGKNCIQFRCRFTLKLISMIESNHEVHCVNIFNEHVWTINKRTQYGDFFVAVWEIQNEEYIMIHKELLPTTCESAQLIEHDKYVYAASKDGVIIRFLKNRDAIQRGELEIHLIFIDLSPIDTLLIINDQQWCTSGYKVYIYDDYSLATSISYPLSHYNSRFRIMMLTSYRDEVWLSHQCEPLVSVFDTGLRKWKMDVDFERISKRFYQLKGVNNIEITSMCSELDTIWIGLSNGIIVVLSAIHKTFKTCVTPYRGPVLHLVPILGNGATRSEKALILSYGHAYSYYLAVSIVLNEVTSGEESDREQNALILWECQSSEEFKVMQMRAERKGTINDDLSNNFTYPRDNVY
ncbi:Leucine-rich repeat serine/threonine-protein kinase 2-like [Oopsacas minuta]|uniref:non-specific serine/threonine protein kinase n=1 Tax=Oopsacas minuta TaxID=111878 RepID=A0AAV7JCN1_9METZ|nr:Leucine-rich repeat serine/threonine-protein kinase 2-like [Oopsacas minuta]